MPLGANPKLAPAKLTGLVSPDTPIVPISAPVPVEQTINSSMAPPKPVVLPDPVIPVASSTPPRSSNSPRRVTISQATTTTTPAAPVAPTARGALLNLASTTYPDASESAAIPSRAPASSLPLRPSSEIMNQSFEVRNYQGIISNSSLENELLSAGYAPLSKIVIRTDDGDKRTQYIKALNKNGQKVFILVDVHGYTTARASDLTLIEAHNVSIVPYSLKTGAFNCAGKDVCGVAFECGPDAVCVLSRGSDDLKPKEANFVFVEQHVPSAASLEVEGSIMTYPVIRLSEIRANPDLVLSNTDVVTRRLRNEGYKTLLTELVSTQHSINKLNEAFVRFNCARDEYATKLNQTLTILEKWNREYLKCPPTTDEGKDKYRKLQFNLAQRNEGIATLLRSIKKVADKKAEIDALTKEINDITDFCVKEFATVEYANSD
jgi:hypothetical protein